MSDVVIVTGSRDWPNYGPIWRALSARAPGLVVHGGCDTGADEFADAWARQNQVDRYAFAARWGTRPNVDRSAGPKRNSRMLKAYPYADVFAFPLRGQTKGGTVDCMAKALNMGMRVFVLSPDLASMVQFASVVTESP